MSLILEYSSASLLLHLAFRELVHASSTSGDFATLLHAVKLAAAGRLGLAHHVVIVVVLASRSNEVGGTEQRRRTGSELLDLGDVIGQRGGVDEGFLVEPGLD
jgi:hypothetical protein